MASQDYLARKPHYNALSGLTMIIILLSILLVLIGSCIELTKFGDRYEVREEEDEQALYEASKFRRLE